MSDTILSIISGQPAAQPQQVVPAQPVTTAAAPQAPTEVVTISAQGRQAVQQTAQYSPAEEQKESATHKAVETQAGKK